MIEIRKDVDVEGLMVYTDSIRGRRYEHGHIFATIKNCSGKIYQRYRNCEASMTMASESKGAMPMVTRIVDRSGNEIRWGGWL